jgi:hypothetical protein
MLSQPKQQDRQTRAINCEARQAPLVSILVNNYNYGQFLEQAIESCLSQTYQPVEVIVVDDGSTDDSDQVIASFGDRIIPVLKQNGGQGSAINAGYQVSQGSLIVMLDADDYLCESAVEQIMGRYHSGAAQVQYRLNLIDGAGQYIDLMPAPEITFDSGQVVPLLLQQGRYSTTVTSGLSFSRAALAQILPMPEPDFHISADGYLVTVAPFFGEVVSIDAPLGYRRRHGVNRWSLRTNGIEQFRKDLAHDELKYKALRERALQENKPVSNQLGLTDLLHLRSRLSSLRLDPQRHPYDQDRRWQLGGWGVRAALQHRSLSAKRRFVLCLWFLLVAVLPQKQAKTVIYWLLSPESRPTIIQTIARTVRNLTR